MHELSIMGSIFDIIHENIDEHAMSVVTGVTLKVGEFSCVEEDALRFAFGAYCRNTEIVKGATLIIIPVPGTAYCDSCDHDYPITFTEKKCPDCQGYSGKIVTGQELFLENITGE